MKKTTISLPSPDNGTTTIPPRLNHRALHSGKKRETVDIAYLPDGGTDLQKIEVVFDLEATDKQLCPSDFANAVLALLGQDRTLGLVVDCKVKYVTAKHRYYSRSVRPIDYE